MTDVPSDSIQRGSEHPAANQVVRVEGALTVEVAETWRARLLGALAAKGTVTIDFSATTGIDAFGLQLLCALRCSATARGRTVRVMDPVGVLSGAAVAAGFPETLFEISPACP